MPYSDAQATSSSRTPALQLELDRINLLYRQNLASVVANITYVSALAYVSSKLAPLPYLQPWVLANVAMLTAHVAAAIFWIKRSSKISSLNELKLWHYWLILSVFLSGALWAPMAFIFPQTAMAQQLLISMTVVFGCAGSITIYAASYPVFCGAALPMWFAWNLALFMSPDPNLHILGAMAVVILCLGMRAAWLFNRYVIHSLQLAIENAKVQTQLTESNEKLTMALAASGALTWTWNPKSHKISCEGNIKGLLGLPAQRLEGQFEEYLSIVHPDDRDGLRESIQRFAEAGGDIEHEHRLHFEGSNRTYYVAIRGRAEVDAKGAITEFRGICWDVTGKRVEERLRYERDMQEAANRSKSIFLANASHEMRTPLASINGYTEAALETELTSRARQDLQVVLRTGKYLTCLVNDFLDLSRIETGQLYIQKEMFPFQRDIQDTLEIVRPLLRSKDVGLHLKATTPLPSKIESDSTRFRQVLTNLLTNAAKYTPSGGIVVELAFEPCSDGQGILTVNVIDTGVGISDKLREHLFLPFVRGETAYVKRTEGAGLGLALSRSLARKLGGDLTIVNSSATTGTEFEWTLQVSGFEMGSISASEAETGLPSNRPLTGARILVAEDSADLRELMERVFVTQGATVDTCQDGAQALALALEKPYTIILMDINMPVMDGYTATTQLRKKGYARPILALSAHASIEHRRLADTAGFTGYLAKPIDIKNLVFAIQEAVCIDRGTLKEVGALVQIRTADPFHVKEVL